jgi:hypothetical protein
VYETRKNAHRARSRTRQLSSALDCGFSRFDRKESAWKPVIEKIENHAPFADLKSAILKMHKDVRDYLHAR